MLTGATGEMLAPTDEARIVCRVLLHFCVYFAVFVTFSAHIDGDGDDMLLTGFALASPLRRL